MSDSQVVELPARTTSNPVTPINANPPSVQQTPIAYKTATQEHAMNAPTLSDAAYKVIGRETLGHYLVGMAPQDFLEEFLPWNQDTPDDYKQRVPDQARRNSLLTVPPRPGQTENHMYAPFVKALDNWVTGTDNGQKLRFGRFAKPDLSCSRMNVDISTYWEQDYPANQGSPDATSGGSCTFASQQTHEEFKSDHTQDAFRHKSDEGPNNEDSPEEPEQAPEGGQAAPSAEGANTPEVVQIKTESQDEDLPSLIAKVEVDSQRANLTRGQIAAYAGVAMSMAFRNHFFSMLILGKYARIIRWDRRGAIVTSRFDYTQRPQLIFDFYLRFAQLSPRQRGFDTNVEPVKESLPVHVAKAFDNYYQEAWYQGAKYGHKDNTESNIPASLIPFFRIRIEDRVAGRTETFFIPTPPFRHSHLHPFSRASRRCLAFPDTSLNKPKMCFLKDSWQEPSARTAPEADVYRILHANNVPNIASFRLGDDVAGLETETQKKFHVLSHSGRFRKLGDMVCHRLILDTVARDLSTFTWRKVLLSCLADAVDACQEAYKAGVLHRDISAGNIMIVRNEETHEWRGVLIDWDMCLLLDQRDNFSDIRTARTGTWAFMSARILSLPEPEEGPVIHSLADDMESFLWVLIYELLRYTKHNLGPDRLSKRLHLLFEYSAKQDGVRIGGDTKQTAMLSCKHKNVERGIANFKVQKVTKLLRKLAVVFHSRYPNDTQDNVNDGENETDNESDSDSDDDSESDSESNDRTPSIDLDAPDEKWLSNTLRQVAIKMRPRKITPTALISFDKNHKPPEDRSKWITANTNVAKPDYHKKYFITDEYDSEKAQASRFKSLTPSMVYKIDGRSYSSSKRRRDEDGITADQMKVKKQRPLS